MRGFDRRLLTVAPSVRGWIVYLAATSTIGLAGTVALAAGAAGLLARALGARPWPHALLLLIVGGVFRTAAIAGREAAAHCAGAQAEAQTRTALFTGLASRPARSVQDQTDASRTLAGPRLSVISDSVTQVLPSSVAASITPLATLAVISVLDPLSGLTLAITLPVVVVFLILVGLHTRDRSTAQWARLSALSARFLDLVEGLPSLRAYGRAERQIAQVRSDAQAYRNGAIGVLRTAFLSGFVLDVGAALSVALVSVSVGLRLDNGHLPVRTGLLVLLLTPEVFAPIRALGANYHQQVSGDSALDEVFALLGAPATVDAPDSVPAPSDTADPGTATSVDGLAGVSVLSADRPRPVLSDVDISVPAGTSLAITGRSGAGKSTVLALLLHQLLPDSGAVVAARPGARTCWVPQRPQLSAPTVVEELRQSVPGADDDAIATALAECRAPGGHVPLGEAGSALSAGERRRVSLATALLRARALRQAGALPLVLLDEPTEGLDKPTARVVQHVLRALHGWSTVLVVTHDLALAEGCDAILTLTDGRAQPPRPGHGGHDPHPLPPAASWTARTPSSGGTASPDAHGARSPSWWPALGTRGVALALLATGLAATAGVGLTSTSVWLVCRAAQRPNVAALAIAVVGVRFFALAKSLLRYAERVTGHQVALTTLVRVRTTVFAQLIPLSPGGFAGWRRGDLLRRFTVDADAAQDLVARIAQPVTAAVIAAGAALTVVGIVEPDALPLAALGVVIALIGGPAAGIAGHQAGRAGARASAERDRIAVAAITALPFLQAHDAVGTAVSRIAEHELELRRLSWRQGRATALGTVLSAGGGVIALAGALTVHGISGPAMGAASGALLAAAETLTPLPVAGATFGRVRESLARVGRVLAPDLTSPAPQRSMSGGDTKGGRVEITEVPSRPATLVTDAVTLRWPGGPDLAVGDGVYVSAGDRLGVTGVSGAGKSTLIDGLCGLLPPHAGSVIFLSDDGFTDLYALQPDARARLVAGSVDGDHVFTGTLRDNIAIGRPAPTRELWRALSDVGLSVWVSALPDQLETRVGTDGAQLSGGQRQRLLLARALLIAPAVLVLDEPTAHLDPATEADVTAGLVRALEGRTAVVVTHRAPVLAACTHTTTVAAGQLIPTQPVAGTGAHHVGGS